MKFQLIDSDILFKGQFIMNANNMDVNASARLDKLREYLADELKQAIPSITYINDLQDSIKAIEYRMGLGQKTFEMVNAKAALPDDKEFGYGYQWSVGSKLRIKLPE